MGVYDTIAFNCPECNEELFAQSKSGARLMATYSGDSVPISVALDANRHAPFACKCGRWWHFEDNPDWPELKTEPRVRLIVKEEKQND